ncbi:MAG: hypothetical protein H0V84_05625 [Actinobacteria bacterium]|nr:hypothetical protein [Actinomycetota bacterium]
MTTPAPSQPLIVLDDDPTGTQAVVDTPVLLEWDAELVSEAARGARAVHLLTNVRAFPPERARAVTHDGARTAVEALGEPRLALRGDSTLRGHLLEEYLAVCDARFGGRRPPLLLVPALPHAGRVTVDGVHLIERNGTRTPLHETEYARDGGFAYSDARLLRWAEERTYGLLRADEGLEVKPAGVAAAIGELQGTSTVVVPDAETLGDLEVIAGGLRAAEREGAEVVVRSAPTFVGVLAGNLAVGFAEPPATGGPLLVVVGSYVPQTTRQLAALASRHPESIIEVNVAALASGSPETEIERAAREARRRLESDGLAVLATPRERPVGVATLDAGERIAAGLARAAGAAGASVVLTKGGITAAVTARVGLGARRAICRGPLVDGVALWELEDGTPYVVFPGNIGDDATLLEVVELLRG